MRHFIRNYKRCLYLIIIIAVGLALYRFSPTAYWFWPQCPFRLLTGLNCPACGIQRFIHALTNGNAREAIAYNYYLVYALPYAACVIATHLLPTSRLKSRMEATFEGRTAIGIYVVSFCAWLVVRNILGI